METTAGSLTLTKASTNTTLVPLSGIVFGGSGASRTVTVTPAADQNGTATITVTVTDGDGASTSDTFLLTVTPVNDAPSGADKAVTINEDASYTFASADFGFSDPSDSPPNTLQAVKITTLPGVGSLKDNGVAVTTGQFVSAADITGNKLVFTPVANANGTPYTSFTFQVQDNGGTANSGVDLDQSPNTVTINVTAVNDDPVIVSVTNDGPISEESSATITVSATDVDGDTLHYEFDCGHDGTFEIGPQLSSSTTCFFADPGSYQVDVRATDGNSGSALGSTTVTVSDVIPTITVTKTPGTTSLPEPGGPVSFTVTVKNNDTAESIDLDSLMDSVYGDLLDGSNPAVSSNTCASASPTIAAGATLTCSFTGAVSGQPGDYFDTVTAHASDNEHNDASDHAMAKVTITDVQPTITVVKTAGDAADGATFHLNEPGGLVTFTVTVHNGSVSSDPVVLSALSDDVYGNLAGQGTCSLPQTIASGADYTCTFSGSFTGNAGASQTDTVTADAKDDELNPATASDDATVTLDDVQPSIVVTKTASPTHVNEPGAGVTFTVTVKNTSVSSDPVTLDSLADDTHGDLAGQGTCAIGGTILPGATYTCAFSATVSGNAAYAETDTVTAHASDDEANDTSGQASATITVDDVAPSVTLDKVVVGPATLAEPGGTFTFKLTITNNSVATDPVTITALTDDNPLSAACLALVGTTVAPGAAVDCTYPVSHDDVGLYPNTASVLVTDDEGSTASSSDGASVTVTNVVPSVDLSKTVDPASRPEPGGLFTYTLSIHNTSADAQPVEITALTDTNALSSDCTDLVGTFLAPDETVSCTYTATFSNAGIYGNTASVTVTDNEATTGDDTALASVTVDDVAPSVTLDKVVVGPATLAEPGGTFTFKLTITNNSVATDPVTITALTDDNPLSAACLALVGTTVAPGAAVDCTYPVSHDDVGLYPNTASVLVTDDEGLTASSSDGASVTVTNVVPSVDLSKTVDPASRPEPGGLFTYTLSIHNTSADAQPVEITALTDTNALSSDCTDLVGTFLAPDETVSCTYTATFSNAGIYGNTASVTVTDNEATTGDDTALASVTVDDVAPSVTLDKVVVGPATLAEPGGTFTFKLTITNNSVATDPVTITALTDDNPLSAACLALVGTTVAPGAAVDCTYPVSHDDVGLYPNTASVLVTDDEGLTASSSDGASVTVTNVVPSVDLSKTVDPASRPEPGGLFTYTLSIHNTSADAQPVEITALTDTNALSSDCTDLVGTFLAPDETVSCTYTATFSNAGIYGNTASVTVTDNEATTGDDTALASVTVDDVAPTITVTKTAAPTHVGEPSGLVDVHRDRQEHLGLERPGHDQLAQGCDRAGRPGDPEWPRLPAGRHDRLHDRDLGPRPRRDDHLHVQPVGVGRWSDNRDRHGQRCCRRRRHRRQRCHCECLGGRHRRQRRPVGP